MHRTYHVDMIFVLEGRKHGNVSLRLLVYCLISYTGFWKKSTWCLREEREGGNTIR